MKKFNNLIIFRRPLIIIPIIIIILCMIINLILFNNGYYKNEPNRYLIISFITLLGFIVQILSVYIAFSYGLDMADIQRERKISKITELLDVQLPQNIKSYKHINLIVSNESDFTISDCIAYVSIDNTNRDLLQNKYLLAVPDDGDRITEDKLSWAKVEMGAHLYKIDIHPKEKQDLLLCKFNNNYNTSEEVIEVACEIGYMYDDKGELKGRSRCMLKNNRNYEFTIKIVSKDTLGKTFKFKYIHNTSEFIKLDLL